MRLALEDPLRAPSLVRSLAPALGGPGFYVSDWTRDHANFFRSIEITKSMMFVILSMIVGGRGLQYRRHPGHDREGEADRHRHPAHPRRGPRNMLITFAIQGVLIGLAGTLLRGGPRHAGGP